MAYAKEVYSGILAEYDEKRDRAQRRADALNEELCRRSPEYAEITARLSSIGARMLLASRYPDKEARIAAIRRETEELRERRIAALASLGYTEEDADVHYECALCSDTGYTDQGICACLKRKLAERQLESSGLGTLCRRCSFDNFFLKYYGDTPENLAHMEKVLAAAKRYADEFDPSTSQSLLLIGGTGLGKTHICAAIARVVAYGGYTVLYTGAQAMFNDFSNERFRNGYAMSELTEKYFSAELLIIDDLGAEAINQFSVSCLYDLINTRLVKGMPVIINTNFDAASLREKYADRITSRLFGEYAVFPFKGKDIRAQKLREI